MVDFVSILRGKRDFVSLKGAGNAEIDAAEQELQVHFSKEYRRFLSVCSIASADGHEFVGISKSPRLDVVTVTNAERSRNNNIPAGWYVVEQTNIDGIVIWQAPDGTVYQATNGQTNKICESLYEYISDDH